MANGRVTSDTRRLNNIISHSDRNNKNFIKAIGFSVEALAKMKAPVDLGNLRSSIYTATNKSNDMPEIPDLEREQLPKPDRDSVYIGPSVEYGIFQELGTTIMDAQPYMIPALREIEDQLRNNPQMAKGIVNE